MRLLSSILAMLVASTIGANAAVFILQAPVAQTGASPTVTTDGTPEAYVGGGSAVILENTLAITCTCSTIDSATITISSGAFTGDVLIAPAQVGITAGFTSNTLTLTGTAAISTYLAILQNVTYSSSNADPTNSGSNLTRTITWNVVNASNPSNSPTTTVNVTAGTPTPTLTPSGSVSTFTSSGSPVALDGGITLTCSCGTLTSASLVISSGLLSGDVLNTVTPGSLTSSYDAPSGTLTLTGTATLAVYQTAFRSITYSSTLNDPTNSGADPTRTVTWTANNSTSAGTASTTVNVQNPSVPTITVAAGNQINYTGGGSPLALDASIGVTCTCVNLTSATIALSSGFFTGDVFAATTSLGITTVYNSSTGVMTFTGNTTVANYQTLLRTLTYSSSSGDPSNGGLNPTRTATWVAFNGANASQPATTAINVFIAGQPSWVMTGAQVAINPATNQSWVNGLGTGPLSAEVAVTRATQETCHTGQLPVAVTFAAANTACATPLGLATWASYTNYVTSSTDLSNTGFWVQFTQGTGSTLAVTANSATDPTNVTTHAAKVVATRTATGSYASLINNGMNTPAGTLSQGVWLQADPGSPGSVGVPIQIGFLSSSGFNVHNVTLNATWTWYPFSNVGSPAAGCNGSTQSCQFQIGLTNQPGNGPANTTLTATFDVWGAELNAGAIVYPFLTTFGSAVTAAADNIQVASGSALETAIAGAASSIFMNSNMGAQSTLATLLDSNGTTLLGESATNFLTTNLAFTLNTTNPGIWTGPTTDNFSRDGSGRTMALNNLVIATDSAATVVGIPLFLGSTLGTSNFFNGYLGTMNVYNTRVLNSQIGVSGTGTNYYFAASGSDANACTIGSPCLSISKAQSIALVTNDTLNFNGGDTFPGCLNENGGTNWNATRVAPTTITSYGTGQAILQGNCTGGPVSPRSQVIELTNTDGVIINNIELLGDSAGNTNIGILMNGPTDGKAHGNILIENTTCHNFHDSSIFEGACIFRNPGNGMYDHVTFLNNTANGLSGVNSTDNNFMYTFGNHCTTEYDAIQGNLIFNLGGNASVDTSPNLVGTGIYPSGSCGLGSTANGTGNGLPGAIMQFNVTHDLGANVGGCGGNYANWSVSADNLIWRMNEVYNQRSTAPGGACDSGAFDFDLATTNSMAERNYAHGDFGACLLVFSSATNITFRWNICDGEGATTQPAIQGVGTGVMYIYNNVLSRAATASTGFGISFNGCPGVGSIFANNIIVTHATATTQNMFSVNPQNATAVCSPPPSGGLQITHNDWWSTHSSFNITSWIDGQGNTNGTLTASISGTSMSVTAMGGRVKPRMLLRGAGIPASTYIISCDGDPCSAVPQTMVISQPLTIGSESMTAVGAVTSTTYANMASLINETGGLSIDPLFVSPYGEVTCGNTTSGPQASNCPAGMKLQSGSSMHAPAGAVLSSAPWSLPANNGGNANNPTNGQGTLDYWGTIVPCPTTGGFPIGAQC